jgi:enamine deaminase RidA (YjgF/YER057c/UK114 family)
MRLSLWRSTLRPCVAKAGGAKTFLACAQSTPVRSFLEKKMCLLHYNLRDSRHDQERAMAAKKRSRREMVQLAGAGALGLAALQGGSLPRKQVFKDPTGTSGTLAAIRSGHLLFVSGIGGYYASRRPGGPGDIKQQTADALDLMKALLEQAGSSMSDLLQVQVALVDSANNWEPMNEVYNTRVPEPRPVRSYFGSTGFPHPGQLLQIDAIAYVD